MPASLRVGGGDGGGGGHGQGASTRKHASQKEGPSSWRRHLHPWAHDLGAELRLHNSVPPPPHSLTLCTQVRTPTAGSALCTALATVTVHTPCPHQPARAALGCCSPSRLLSRVWEARDSHGVFSGWGTCILILTVGSRDQEKYRKACFMEG